MSVGKRGVLGTVGLIVRIVLYAALALIIVYDVYIVIARLAGNGMPTVFGFAFASVKTGSMSPEIMPGDFIVIRSCGEYAPGDIITFYDEPSGSYVTHRIVIVGEDGYTTKGDANSSADIYPVAEEDVVGKVVAVAGGLGGFMSFVRSPFGLMTALGAGIGIWALFRFIPDIIRCGKRGRGCAAEDADGERTEKEGGTDADCGNVSGGKGEERRENDGGCEETMTGGRTKTVSYEEDRQ